MLMSWSPFQARDFDAELARESAAKQVEAHGPTPEEIERLLADAREAAHAEGYRAGRDDARAEAEGSLAAARIASLEALRPRLVDLLSDQQAHRASLEADMASFMMRLCEKALPHLLADHGPVRMEAELRSLARRAIGSRWLEVRVSESNRDAVSTMLSGLLPKDAAAGLRVIADPGMGERAIEAAWQGGRSSMSYDRLCDSIIQALKTTRQEHHQEENSL